MNIPPYFSIAIIPFIYNRYNASVSPVYILITLWVIHHSFSLQLAKNNCIKKDGSNSIVEFRVIFFLDWLFYTFLGLFQDAIFLYHSLTALNVFNAVFFSHRISDSSELIPQFFYELWQGISRHLQLPFHQYRKQRCDDLHLWGCHTKRTWPFRPDFAPAPSLR